MQPNDIIEFWFEELSPKDWWKKNPELDARISERFLSVHSQAVCGELHDWRNTSHGRLAEIIVIDQFSRNMFRGKPESFASDNVAVVLSQEAIRAGADKPLNNNERAFLYMPLMHSESRRVHELAMIMYDQPGLENNFNFEKKHLAIIDRFGRYPHRNKILGRTSTSEEIEFLQGPGSSF
ncbi:MAG: DUF924 domain-containing protein [Gammaproteobacteria bacterium]|nr:DUF924 domain-containing protein [Gammaproteobacteria bacterium]